MPRRPVSGLEAHVGYWLRYVSNHVSHAFGVKLEAHGVTVAEWVVLRSLLGVEATTPSRLAETLGMTRGAVSKLVDRLTAKGLVVCEAKASDRRFQSLSLTPAATALVPKLAAAAGRNDDEFFGHLGPERRAELIALMKEVVRLRGLSKVPVE